LEEVSAAIWSLLLGSGGFLMGALRGLPGARESGTSFAAWGLDAALFVGSVALTIGRGATVIWSFTFVTPAVSFAIL
jgi:hypothetical protein